MKTLLVCGYGSGISDAVVRRFSSEGFKIAIAARNAGKLAEAKRALHAQGIDVTTLVADLSNPAAAARLVHDARAALGPISVVTGMPRRARRGICSRPSPSKSAKCSTLP